MAKTHEQFFKEVIFVPQSTSFIKRGIEDDPDQPGAGPRSPYCKELSRNDCRAVSKVFRSVKDSSKRL